MIKESVHRVMLEEDENGEPRFIHTGDGYFKENPKFIEPKEFDGLE